MKTILIFIYLLLMCYFCAGQNYGSNVYINDTIFESGDFIMLDDSHIYILSKTRCQPNAQSCGQIRKFDINLDLLWTIDLPLSNIGNDNSLHLYKDSILVTAGIRNSSNQDEGFYHYEVSTDGEIISFVYHPLPYERNLNYGNLISNNILYMYGASIEDISISGINVDALILTYDFDTKERVNDYFDYGNLAIDLYDLQQNSDSTLLFISRRRQETYISERDYVIEEIQPNGSRKELYNVKVPNETGIENTPSLEILSDGRIAFFNPDETEFGTSRTIRILNSSGDFLQDVIIWGQIFPDVSNHYNLTGTMDGGFVISGQYFDRTMSDGTSKMNGMLLKISNIGDLEWVRQYKHYHNITGGPVRSFLFDVKELPNGDIVATGSVENSTSDLWVIKTNSEGCLGDEDCGEITVSISEEIIQTNYVNVYPNPVAVGRDLQVEVSSQISGRVVYRMLSIHGDIVSTGDLISGRNIIDTSTLVIGMYTIQVDLGEKGLETHQVVVH